MVNTTKVNETWVLPLFIIIIQWSWLKYIRHSGVLSTTNKLINKNPSCPFTFLSLPFSQDSKDIHKPTFVKNQLHHSRSKIIIKIILILHCSFVNLEICITVCIVHCVILIVRNKTNKRTGFANRRAIVYQVWGCPEQTWGTMGIWRYLLWLYKK